MLSSRLSCRPGAWSESGADRIAKLRAYKANGGDIQKLFADANKGCNIDGKVISGNMRRRLNSA